MQILRYEITGSFCSIDDFSISETTFHQMMSECHFQQYTGCGIDDSKMLQDFSKSTTTLLILTLLL
jgi:hypothetical protein